MSTTQGPKATAKQIACDVLQDAADTSAAPTNVIGYLGKMATHVSEIETAAFILPRDQPNMTYTDAKSSHANATTKRQPQAPQKKDLLEWILNNLLDRW